MVLSFLKDKITLFILAIAVIIIVALIYFNKKAPIDNKSASNNSISAMNESSMNEAVSSEVSKNVIEVGDPEISGWIAWWEEDDGFNIVEKYSKNLTCISPNWLKLDTSGKLIETGKMNKLSASEKIRNVGLKLFPMLTTDFNDQQLSVFIRNEKSLNNFAQNLSEKLIGYGADGVDLDFENIGSPYSADFSKLVAILGENLKKNGLKFSVAVQAQTGKDDWDGLKGQDLKLIADMADEVRLMIYDRHGEFSEPGPVSPMDWYADVINYNLKLIPRDKIVIGLPTYGYIWQPNAAFQSLQFKDFIAFSNQNKFKVSRDPASYELKYTSIQSTGWLSDSAAVINKMEYARKIGLNKFIIWNLGGTDEKLFNKKWKNIKVNSETINP